MRIALSEFLYVHTDMNDIICRISLIYQTFPLDSVALL